MSFAAINPSYVATPLEKQNAPEALGLRTRECHSALTAMGRSRRNRKPDLIYPRYSGVSQATRHMSARRCLIGRPGVSAAAAAVIASASMP